MPSHKRVAGLRPLSAILPVCSILMVLVCGCANPRAAGKGEQHAPPATVQNAPKEADLATITLTPQAEQRLGITLAPVSLQRVTRTRNFGADVVLPPDRRTVVTAPMSGTLLDSRSAPVAGMSVRSGQALYRLLPYLPPERYLRLQLESEVAAAETRVEAARVRSERADQLLRDQAGSEKAAQQAREELELARNDLKSARSRLEKFVSSPLSSDTALTIAAPRDGMLQNVFVTPGQAVPAGAPLFEVTDYSLMWIRVPVYVGELGQIDTGHYAVVRGLTDPPGRPGYRAKPVTAPLTADPNAATVDLYFELANQALKAGRAPEAGPETECDSRSARHTPRASWCPGPRFSTTPTAGPGSMRISLRMCTHAAVSK